MSCLYSTPLARSPAAPRRSPTPPARLRRCARRASTVGERAARRPRRPARHPRRPASVERVRAPPPSGNRGSTGRNPWRRLNPNKAAATEFLRDGAMEVRGGVAASGDEERRRACFCCKYRGRGTTRDQCGRRPKTREQQDLRERKRRRMHGQGHSRPMFPSGGHKVSLYENGLLAQDV